ncbi:uncharacterized protein TNCV_4083621 [Trichonephila clavipes]|nr:uncharacterized protein TNCV_4083621 [Trichonephila clavipes]
MSIHFATASCPSKWKHHERLAVCMVTTSRYKFPSKLSQGKNSNSVTCSDHDGPSLGNLRPILWLEHYTKYSRILQDVLFICYKQSPDNAHSVASYQRSGSLRLIEDETFNDSDIINNLIGYEDGQEARFFESGKKYAGMQLSNKLKKHSLKIDTNKERSTKIQKKGFNHVSLVIVTFTSV